MANPLPYRVECRHASFGGFEPIAAFNVQVVAEGYAKKCAQVNEHNTYRVIKSGKILLLTGA